MAITRVGRLVGAGPDNARLGLGAYTLVITATNAAGQRSSPKSLSFTIVK
jgi:hypothetical protein